MESDRRTAIVFRLVLRLRVENRLLAHGARLAAAVQNPENRRWGERKQARVELGADDLRRRRHDGVSETGWTGDDLAIQSIPLLCRVPRKSRRYERMTG